MEKPHKRLELWKASMELVALIYKFTHNFPSHEQFALTSQIRRSAVSVPANIAEGAARRTKKEFMQYLHISQGSLSELDPLLELSRGLKYLTQEAWNVIDAQMVRIDKMISGLIRKLHHPIKNTPV